MMVPKPDILKFEFLYDCFIFNFKNLSIQTSSRDILNWKQKQKCASSECAMENHFERLWEWIFCQIPVWEMWKNITHIFLLWSGQREHIEFRRLSRHLISQSAAADALLPAGARGPSRER